MYNYVNDELDIRRCQRVRVGREGANECFRPHISAPHVYPDRVKKAAGTELLGARLLMSEAEAGTVAGLQPGGLLLQTFRRLVREPLRFTSHLRLSIKKKDFVKAQQEEFVRSMRQVGFALGAMVDWFVRSEHTLLVADSGSAGEHDADHVDLSHGSFVSPPSPTAGPGSLSPRLDVDESVSVSSSVRSADDSKSQSLDNIARDLHAQDLAFRRLIYSTAARVTEISRLVQMQTQEELEHFQVLVQELVGRGKWVKSSKAPHIPTPYVRGTMTIATRRDAPIFINLLF